MFAASDVIDGKLVRIDQVGAHLVERGAQWLVRPHAVCRCRALAIGTQEGLIVAAGLAEAGTFTALCEPLVKQVLEIVLQCSQALRRSLRIEDEHQLLAQVLP
ncbi:hypothetical protein D3C81_1535260 [compost metagenome]